MDRFFGFDLGDAESAVSRLSSGIQPAAGEEKNKALPAAQESEEKEKLPAALEVDGKQKPAEGQNSAGTRKLAGAQQGAVVRKLPAKQDVRAQRTPQMLTVAGAKSFITAYATLASGKLVIGENACFAADVIKRKLRFKSRFLKDPASHADVKSFAAGVLGELYSSGDLVQGEDCCFYIGCPAGWDKNTREKYRQIFENCGYPPVRIVSESRAAMVSACQSKHLQVGYDILSRPVLVIDIG